LYRITFVLDLFKGDKDRPLSHKALKTLLYALMYVDMLELQDDPSLPLIFKAGVKYQEEPPGQEDWQDVLTCIRLGIADCLPLSTLVMRENFTFTTMGSLKPGDRIMGDGKFTTVLEAVATGLKDILSFDLENGCILKCSPRHRLFLQSGEEIRASEVKVGQRLKTLSLTPSVHNFTRVKAVRVSGQELCGDIETDSGRFYLPESDLVVHNCEDLACWRAAELRVRYGIQAEPTFIWKLRPNGGYLYHILVKLPDGRIEDPSRTLGMR
jgi:hypothetical protein